MVVTSENTRIGVKLQFEPEGNDRLSIFAVVLYILEEYSEFNYFTVTKTILIYRRIFSSLS